MPLPVDAAIREFFAPALRTDGFSGSGRTFRRIINGFICVVNVQSSRSGGQFAINLGLHPVAIPMTGSKRLDVKNIAAADCEFRRRLSAGGADKWWLHPLDSDLPNALKDACQLYETVGRSLFAKQTATDAPLLTVTSAQFETEGIFLSGFGTTDVRQAYVLALMRYLANEREEAAAFARIALARLGSSGGLKRELEEIVEGTWKSEEPSID
jgi:hypothetical protein